MPFWKCDYESNPWTSIFPFCISHQFKCISDWVCPRPSEYAAFVARITTGVVHSQFSALKFRVAFHHLSVKDTSPLTKSLNMAKGKDKIPCLHQKKLYQLLFFNCRLLPGSAVVLSGPSADHEYSLKAGTEPSAEPFEELEDATVIKPFDGPLYLFANFSLQMRKRIILQVFKAVDPSGFLRHKV